MQKKIIFVNIFLGLIFICSIISFSVLINICSARWQYWNTTAKELLGFITDKFEIEQIHSIYIECIRLTVSIVFSILSAILSATLLFYLDLKVFNSTSFADLREGIVKRAEKRKADRQQAKINKQKADKNARISQLEKELSELKKDE